MRICRPEHGTAGGIVPTDAFCHRGPLGGARRCPCRGHVGPPFRHPLGCTFPGPELCQPCHLSLATWTAASWTACLRCLLPRVVGGCSRRGVRLGVLRPVIRPRFLGQRIGVGGRADADAVWAAGARRAHTAPGARRQRQLSTHRARRRLAHAPTARPCPASRCPCQDYGRRCPESAGRHGLSGASGLQAGTAGCNARLAQGGPAGFASEAAGSGPACRRWWRRLGGSARGQAEAAASGASVAARFRTRRICSAAAGAAEQAAASGASVDARGGRRCWDLRAGGKGAAGEAGARASAPSAGRATGVRARRLGVGVWQDRPAAQDRRGPLGRLTRVRRAGDRHSEDHARGGDACACTHAVSGEEAASTASGEEAASTSSARRVSLARARRTTHVLSYGCPCSTRARRFTLGRARPCQHRARRNNDDACGDRSGSGSGDSVRARGGAEGPVAPVRAAGGARRTFVCRHGPYGHDGPEPASGPYGRAECQLGGGWLGWARRAESAGSRWATWVAPL